MHNNFDAKKSCLNVGVIGAGWIANLSHGPVLRDYAGKHPEICLKAVCDVVDEKAAQFSKAFGFERRYADVPVMLEKEDLHAVYVLVPGQLMSCLAEVPLRLGIPTFLEKPPGKTSREVMQLIQTARETGAPNFVAFNRRCMPLVVKMQKRLLSIMKEEGVMPESVSYLFSRNGRFDSDFSTTAIHPIDAVSFLCQSPYESARIDYQKTDPTHRHDNIFMNGKLASGARVSIEIIPDAGLNCERIIVHFPNRTLALALPCVNGVDGAGLMEEYHRGEKVAGVAGGDMPERLGDGFYLETEMFLDGLLQGKREFTGHDLASTIQSVEIMHALGNKEKSYHAGEQARNLQCV